MALPSAEQQAIQIVNVWKAIDEPQRTDALLRYYIVNALKDAAPKWRSIDTAPRDNTWQLVAKVEGSEVVWWHRAKYSPKYTNCAWKTQGGWCVPTHWMPVPDSLNLTERKEL